MKSYGKFIISLLLVAGLSIACDEVKEYPWNPEWDKYQPEEPVEPSEPEQPVEPGEPETPEEPVEPENAKGRFVWIDAAANFKDYANSTDNIASDMKRIKETGFTAVIVDVRPTNSGVLFNSATEGPLTKVDAWVNGQYQWVTRTETFDYLQAFINEGKKVGLDVYASINTMIGGFAPNPGYGMDPTGFLFEDSTKKSWATIVNTTEGLKNTLDLGSGTKFLNPANDEVVEYLTDLLADLASYEGLKGIILDRCRYDDNDLQSDFSDVSREKFEEFIGREVENWPGDIFKPGQENLDGDGTELQKKWMAFRAKMIHDFIEKVSNRVHQVNPGIRFGAYVGGWYSSYYHSGVNWASPNYETASFYRWATTDYNEYGYADHCDIMIIGAYASTSSIYGSGEWTMQGFCKRAENLFKGDVPFVGGPDIGNSPGFEKGGQGKLMPQIVDACINASTEGMFFFDLCHIKMYNYWSDIKKAFDEYLNSLK